METDAAVVNAPANGEEVAALEQRRIIGNLGRCSEGRGRGNEEGHQCAWGCMGSFFEVELTAWARASSTYPRRAKSGLETLTSLAVS
jgi:hypothetical protein